MSRAALARQAAVDALTATRRGERWTVFGQIAYLGQAGAARIELRTPAVASDPAWQLTQYDQHGRQVVQVASTEADAAAAVPVVAELRSAMFTSF